MVGLTVVLDSYTNKNLSAETTPQVISKVSMIKPSQSSSPSGFSWRIRSTSASGFLDHCFLCKQRLLPGKDIYMYKGDKAFCSVECRCRQIAMDEEESSCTTAVTGYTSREYYNCSLAAMKQPHKVCATSSSSPSSSCSGKGARNRSNNAFAY